MGSRLARIDGKIQRGRGKGAKFFGQSFDVYRLGPKSDMGGIIGKGSLFASNVLGQFERAGKSDVDTETPGKTLFYAGDLDMRPYREGDVFVQSSNSYKPENLIFTCAGDRPAPQHPVFASTPILATFSRPISNVNHIDSGRAPMSAPIEQYELPLTLLGKEFAFAPTFAAAATATHALVPVGMVMERLRDYPKSDGSLVGLPDDTRRQTWTGFVPLLPGVTLVTRDILTDTSSGDRYEITGDMSVVSAFRGQLITLQSLR